MNQTAACDVALSQQLLAACETDAGGGVSDLRALHGVLARVSAAHGSVEQMCLQAYSLCKHHATRGTLVQLAVGSHLHCLLRIAASSSSHSFPFGPHSQQGFPGRQSIIHGLHMKTDLHKCAPELAAALHRAHFCVGRKPRGHLELPLCVLTWAAAYGMWAVLLGADWCHTWTYDAPAAVPPAGPIAGRSAPPWLLTARSQPSAANELLKAAGYEWAHRVEPGAMDELLSWLRGRHSIQAVGCKENGLRGTTSPSLTPPWDQPHPLLGLLDHEEMEEFTEVWDILPAPPGVNSYAAGCVLPQLLLSSACPAARAWAGRQWLPQELQEDEQADTAAMTGTLFTLPLERALLCFIIAGDQPAAREAAQGVHGAAGGGNRGQAPFTTGLILAAYMGHANLVRWLLEGGVPVDIDGVGYITPLQAAAYAGQVECMQVLLDAGASTTYVTANGYEGGLPVMDHACAGGHQPAVRLLVEGGVTLGFHPPPSDHVHESEPIIAAITSCDVRTYLYILEHSGPQGGVSRRALHKLPTNEVGLRMLLALHSNGQIPTDVQEHCVALWLVQAPFPLLERLLQAGFAVAWGECLIHMGHNSKHEIMHGGSNRAARMQLLITYTGMPAFVSEDFSDQYLMSQNALQMVLAQKEPDVATLRWAVARGFARSPTYTAQLLAHKAMDNGLPSVGFGCAGRRPVGLVELAMGAAAGQKQTDTPPSRVHIAPTIETHCVLQSHGVSAMGVWGEVQQGHLQNSLQHTYQAAAP